CLPEVAAQGGRLVQDVCAPNNACVPCFDPVDGTATGACTQPGDSGPLDEEPRVFENCCGDGGRCIPNSSVDPGDRGRLGRSDCETPADALCVPAGWLGATRPKPTSCRAPGNIEGRCLSACLPEVEERANNLAQTTCPDDELCVPCFDPLNTNATGACTTEGDSPREAPKRYTTCCGGTGTCVPGEILDGTGALNNDTCADPEAYCIPTASANGGDPGFRACDGTLGRGACVPECFIDSGRRGWLNQSSCREDQLCAPCSRVEETGVCREQEDED
ncbi:MAG: hypothetical protein ABW321_16280, partial [Polyangiales bacterium]